MNAEQTRADLRRHYEQSRRMLLAAIDGLSDAEMTEPSIDGWSVKDHLAHLTAWDEIRLLEVERISAGGGPAWQIMSPEQVAWFNDLTAQMRSPLSVAQVRADLQRSRERLLEAIMAATDRGLDETLYGEAGLRSGHEAEHADIISAWRAPPRG